MHSPSIIILSIPFFLSLFLVGTSPQRTLDPWGIYLSSRSGSALGRIPLDRFLFKKKNHKEWYCCETSYAWHRPRACVLFGLLLLPRHTTHPHGCGGRGRRATEVDEIMLLMIVGGYMRIRVCERCLVTWCDCVGCWCRCPTERQTSRKERHLCLSVYNRRIRLQWRPTSTLHTVAPNSN